MTRYFVTATGTGIGKTFVTAALAHKTKRAAYKPVISGFTLAEAATSDSGQLLAAMNRPVTLENITEISPWRYEAPLAPSMAAKAEGKSLDVGSLINWSHKIREGFMEGVGGVMVPLQGRQTVLDWMAAIDWPVILVTGSYLGSLSHTLTAISVMKARNIMLHAVVISESLVDSVGLEATRQALTDFITKPTHLITLARSQSWQHPNMDMAWI
ncbi:MAG: dethiobiotin synthase [Alphaproteobacteria bacterium]|jgi:dethiobiotin synthetase